jgi:head-tail adaptor
MDIRATLQGATRTPDGGGGFSQGWNGIATVWIALEAVSAGESYGPGRLESPSRYRVTLRRRSDVAAGMRLVTAARTLVIQGVLDDGPRLPTIMLLCEDLT